VFKAHRLLYHSTLGLRVIKKKKRAVYPATHSQSVTFGVQGSGFGVQGSGFTSSLPGAELVPAGHTVQLPVPVAAVYVPAAHAVHVAPLYPAKHLQSSSAPLPDAELVCEGHAVQLPVPTVVL